MNLMTWLLVGHLVGDWLLQNDWMAKGKKQGLITKAGMTHFVIYTGTIMVAAAISQRGPTSGIVQFVLAALFVFVTHWLVDATSVVRLWMRVLRQTDIPMVHVMVDQSFHIVTLALFAQAVAG